jgi:hypothetical protein
VTGRGWAIVAALVLLVAAACGDDDTGERDASPSTTTTAPSTTTSTAAPSGRCSAAGVDGPPAAQPALPPPVAERRDEIAAAAEACDFAGLAELAEAGSDRFSFTFGGSDDPGRHWREQEVAGEQPLRLLAELLERPFATTELSGEELYVWPSAATYPSWKAVPAAARDALRPLYGPDDFEDFAGFGSYIGYRVGITASGDWIYFVAGD